MTRKQTVIVKLRRSDKSQPWGIRIVGGADLGTPIIVTRSENEELHKGDVIKKIDDYDARDVRHVDAQNLLQKSESVKLVVDRPKVPTPRIRELPKSPIPPIEEYRPYSPDKFDLPHEHIDEVREERFYLEQPYRTTPLVLPGAKVKKDAPLGECYLRHHPNPMIRAAPHHYEAPHPEVAMKQKVAETVLQRVLGPNDVPKVVHKQFNSPIGLYSEQNIADSIKCQTSAVPIFIDFSFLKQKQQIQEQAKILKEQAVAAASNNVWPQFNKPNYALKKPVKYDPSKSEAYKALQEEALGDSVHEVKQPARTGVFSPHKANQNKINQPAPKSPAASYVNALNDEGEKIHQSNSFKRIMYSVLGQTDY